MPNIRINPNSSNKIKVAMPNPHDWTSGLVGYWTMDGQDISGATLTDKSGEGNNGTIHGAVGKAGVVGQALSFDGVDDYVNCGNGDSLDITDRVTLEMWIKDLDAANGYMQILGKSHKYSFYVRYAGFLPAYNFRVKDAGGTWHQTPTIQPGAGWHHVIGTFDNSLPSDQLKIYLDGILEGVGTYTGTIAENAATNFLISGMAGDCVGGLIDEVRIYNRALSAEEIQQHYNFSRRRLKL